MIKKFYIIGIISLVLTSCEGNNIYFDIKEQAIVSCNSKGINRLYIDNDSIAEHYVISWNDNLKNAPKLFKLDEIDKNFKITKSWKEIKTNTDDFILSSFSRYTIERSGGDAAGFEISVRTDSKGKVIEADIEFCE